MKSRKQQIIEFIKNFNSSMYSLNTKGAKYYGASFYARNKWDGSFDWHYEDVKDYDYVVDLTNLEFIKEL